MEYLNSLSGLLLVFGIIALIVVGVIYLKQKKKPFSGTTASIMGSESQEEYIPSDINPLNADVLKAHLSPLSSDQPLFIHSVVNILKRAKTASDIKLIKSIIEQISVQSDLLSKIGEYEELFYVTKGKPKDFDRRDDINELTHERDKLNLLNEIELLKNPPPPPPTPPPPKSQAERRAEDKRRKEAEAARHEAEVRTWRKDLSEDPNFDNEDIETEIERRKRARGWLDSI